MRARLLFLVPLLSFAIVFAATLSYYELRDDEGASVAKPTAEGTLIVALESNPTIRLYSIAVDGSDSRLVTRTQPPAGAEFVEAHPDWSAEAQRIVFTRYAMQGGEPEPPTIWTSTADGGDLTQLTQGRGADYLPAWSPDGTKIAFTRMLRDRPEIFVMNADGSRVMQLTSDRATHDEDPAWSPDGERIAFSSGGAGGRNLVVVSSDGSDPVQLTSGPFEASGPDWSPDGTQLAFVCDSDLCLIGSEQGSRAVQLLGTRPPEFSPQWSPDGKWIAFVRDPGVLMLLDVKTTRPVRVPLHGDTYTFAWGPS